MDPRFNTLACRENLCATGIQEILDLPHITEVAVNQPGIIWFERGDGWEHKSEARCNKTLCTNLKQALSVLSDAKHPLDFDHPIASVILPDGERGQVVIAPATEQDCVSFTFRKPSLTRFTLDDYSASKRLSGSSKAGRATAELTQVQTDMLGYVHQDDMKSFFQSVVQQHMNLLLVGGTGSGKTTFMKSVVDLYPRNRRMFTIEDVHELSLPNHPNHVHLFYKRDGVQPKVLIEACMRMKPDHVFLAELRGDEAWSYLEMLNTGHGGSITTVHANDCYSAFARIAALVKQSEVGQTLEYEFILDTVKSSIDVVCFFKHTHLKEIYFNPEEKNAILCK